MLHFSHIRLSLSLRQRSNLRLASPWLLIALVMIQIGLRPAAANPVAEIHIPVQLCQLSFEAASELDSRFDDAAIADLFAEVNARWQPAGIQWVVESVSQMTLSQPVFPTSELSLSRRAFRQQLVAGSGQPASNEWRVCLLRRFPLPAGGLYAPENQTVFFAERNRLDAYQPVILAHELGHSLGLGHVSDKGNLMYGGAQGGGLDPSASVTPEQIAAARAQALIGPVTAYPEIETGLQPLAAATPTQPGPSATQTQPRLSATQRAAMVARLQRQDRDGDGRVAWTEVRPAARRAFRRIDTNQDGFLDEAEFNAFAHP